MVFDITSIIIGQFNIVDLLVEDLLSKGHCMPEFNTKDKTTVAELLKADVVKDTPVTEAPIIEAPVVEPPKAATTKTSVLLSNNQRIPSNWDISPAGEDLIEAQCGSLIFNGTMAEFNNMLLTGVY